MLKKRNNGVVRLVLKPEEYNRVVSLFTLLVSIDRRINSTKKTNKKKKKRVVCIGSRKRGPFIFCFCPITAKLYAETDGPFLFGLQPNLFFLYANTIMIDTIIITLQKDHYHIHNPELFTPSASWVFSGSPSAHISKQNPTSRDIALGFYKPRLTLANRLSTFGIQPLLKIEVSLPKLLFGNNFAELRYKDFSAVLTKLVQVLQTMGITIAASVLASAPVSAIHYAKNIKLTDGSTPYHYIKKIQETNVQWALDVNRTDYRNDGHSYKWHCNSYEVVFYDKIRDLEKVKQSRKRAVEKDSALQLHLLNRFKKRRKLEFLRMEVRLNKRQKIKQLLQKLDIRSDLTFKKLFKPAISRKVLLHYLDEIEYRRPALLDYTSSDKALLVDLIFSNPTMSPKQIISLYGLKKALEIVNPRELRAMFSRFHPRNWQRLMNEVNKVKLSRIQSPFDEIRRQLMLFKRL